MARHIAIGLKAVLDSVTTTTSFSCVIDAEELPEALDQIGKLTDDDFPEVTAWKKVDGTGRIHLDLREL